MKLFRQIEDRSLRSICFLYCVIILLMISGIRGIANYISFALLVIIMLMYFGRKGGKLSLANKTCVCITLFMVFYLLTSLLAFNAKFFIADYAYYAIAFSPALLAYAIISENHKNAATTVLKVTLFLWTLMCIYSIVLYVINPKFARLAAADKSLTTGIIYGGYPFSIGSALLCVYIFGVIWGKRYAFSRKTNALLIICCAALLAVIILTESTTTTLCTIIGILASIFLNDRGRKTRYKILKIAFFCVVIFITFVLINSNLEAIYSWLGYHSDQLFFYRLKEIVSAFFFDDQTRHFAKRTDTLSESFNTFLNNPIFGVGYKYGNVTSIGRAQYGIGNHSELFDSFAQFGIIGAIPFLMSYYCAVKSCASRYVGLIISLIMLMIFNPFFYFDSNLVVFLIIPLSEFVLIKDEEKDKVC